MTDPLPGIPAWADYNRVLVQLVKIGVDKRLIRELSVAGLPARRTAAALLAYVRPPAPRSRWKRFVDWLLRDHTWEIVAAEKQLRLQQLNQAAIMTWPRQEGTT